MANHEMNSNLVRFIRLGMSRGSGSDWDDPSDDPDS